MAIRFYYRRFSPSRYNLDQLGGPQVGEKAPDFTAERLDGTRVRLADYRGQVVVLETGSVTCPMYERGISAMNALAHRFPEVTFLFMYTREAHPGERIGAHRSPAYKIDCAHWSPTRTASGGPSWSMTSRAMIRTCGWPSAG